MKAEAKSCLEEECTRERKSPSTETLGLGCAQSVQDTAESPVWLEQNGGGENWKEMRPEK